VLEKQTSSAKELITAIKEASLKEIIPLYCASPVKCMPSRLDAAGREKGRYTKS